MRDGVAIATLEAGKIVKLEHAPETSETEIEQFLKVAKLPASLRPYYA